MPNFPEQIIFLIIILENTNIYLRKTIILQVTSSASQDTVAVQLILRESWNKITWAEKNMRKITILLNTKS